MVAVAVAYTAQNYYSHFPFLFRFLYRKALRKKCRFSTFFQGTTAQTIQKSQASYYYDHHYDCNFRAENMVFPHNYHNVAAGRSGQNIFRIARAPCFFPGQSKSVTTVRRIAAIVITVMAVAFAAAPTTPGCFNNG